MKPTRYYSRRQETNVAKKLGGKVQPNSGATMFAKGDLVLDDWLIECKTKVSENIDLSKLIFERENSLFEKIKRKLF